MVTFADYWRIVGPFIGGALIGLNPIENIAANLFLAFGRKFLC